MTKRKLLISLLIGLSAVLLMVAVVLAILFSRGVFDPPTEPVETTTEATTLPPPTQNVFTPKDFAYQGDYLTCLSDESVLGIDVSTYQSKKEPIDWVQVKEAGFEFVMIRLGFRGYVKPNMLEDAWAQEHYRGAKEAGLKVGGYFFSQAISPEEAVEEAKFAMEIVKDWQLDMPLVYDWEYMGEEARTANVDTRTMTDCTKAFCDTVAAGGYQPMIYFNSSQSHNQIYLEELTEYGFWLAMYTDEMDYVYKVDMWQYTKEGSVPGISGNVDINLYFPYDDEE